MVSLGILLASYEVGVEVLTLVGLARGRLSYVTIAYRIYYCVNLAIFIPGWAS